jgi:hypothetical protein
MRSTYGVECAPISIDLSSADALEIIVEAVGAREVATYISMLELITESAADMSLKQLSYEIHGFPDGVKDYCSCLALPFP